MALERPVLRATRLADNRIRLDWEMVPGAVWTKIFEDRSPTGVGNGETTELFSIRGPFNETRQFGYWIVQYDLQGNASPASWKQIFEYRADNNYEELPTEPVEPAPIVPDSWPNALWVGDIPDVTAVQNTGKWGNTQFQRVGGNIQNNAKAMPVTTHDLLGRCFRLSLGSGDLRHEIQPAGTFDSDWDSGEENWFGWNEVLSSDFPITSTNTFSVISQVHQASNSGSPPLEFDAHSGALWVRGSSTAYNRKICPLEVNKLYRIVCGLRIGSGTGTSTINVYVNGAHLVQDYRPNVYFGNDCYWKGASAYASGSIPRPFTHYQNRHRIGRTYASVA